MSFGLESDRIVRDAVDAFLEGRLAPDLPGSTWFETRNSRYTLLDGVLVGARQAALLGAELVGWLDEQRGVRSVHARWSPGSKAILVDRREGRQLVVTSAVKRLGVDERERAASSAPPPRVGPSVTHAWVETTTLTAAPSAPPETTVIGRMYGPPTPPPMPPSSRPPASGGVRLPSPPPPAGPGAARSPLTALAQQHRSSIGARAAAALAAKGLAAPGVPLPKHRSPVATALVPPPPPSNRERVPSAPVVPSD
jgi:hypothetical protein